MMKMEDCKVLENIKIAKDTYKMKIQGDFVKECKNPGQFLNIRIGDGKEFLLRRPISISEINRGEKYVSIVYRIKGDGTRFLVNIKKGDSIDIMGPLGRGYDIFSLKKGETALIIGGGIGIPPLYELVKQFNEKGINTVHLLGFNTIEDVFYEKEFSKLGETYITTVDGTYGLKGYVTDALKNMKIDFNKYYSCGPIIMLKNIVDIINEEKEGYISLENRMACGIGSCYACVCKRKNKEDNYKKYSYEKEKNNYSRVCYDGPVYKVGEIEIM